MYLIQDIINKYKEEKDITSNVVPISERHELVSKFSEKINTKRVADGLKPISNGFINMKMAQSGLKTNTDLYWFFAYCEESKNFDKTWWYSLKASSTPQQSALF